MKLLFLIGYLYIVPEWNEIEQTYKFVASAFGENIKESRRSTLIDKSCFILKKKRSKKISPKGVNKIVTMKIFGLKCLSISVPTSL